MNRYEMGPDGKAGSIWLCQFGRANYDNYFNTRDAKDKLLIYVYSRNYIQTFDKTSSKIFKKISACFFSNTKVGLNLIE